MDIDMKNCNSTPINILARLVLVLTSVLPAMTGRAADKGDAGESPPSVLSLDGEATGATFSPDGKFLASESRTAVTIWDLVAGKRLVDFPAKRCANGLIFTPDSKLLVGGSQEAQATILTWDVPGREPAATLKVRNGLQGLPRLAVSPDSKSVAVFTAVLKNKKSVTEMLFLDLATGNELAAVEMDFNPSITDMAYSPDGQLLAISRLQGNDGPPLVVFDAVKGVIVAGLKSPQNNISSVNFSPDGRRLLACGFNAMEAWETVSQKLLNPAPEKGEFFGQDWARLSADGKTLLTSGCYGLSFYDLQTFKRIRSIALTGNMRCLAVSRDNKRAAFSVAQRFIKVFDLGTPASGPARLNALDGDKAPATPIGSQLKP